MPADGMLAAHCIRDFGTSPFPEQLRDRIHWPRRLRRLEKHTSNGIQNQSLGRATTNMARPTVQPVVGEIDDQPRALPTD